MKITWVLQREKDNVLLVKEVVGDVKYSYSRIPLSEEQAKKTLGYVDYIKQNTTNLRCYKLIYTPENSERYKKLQDRFMELVKEHSEEVEKTPSQRFKTMVPGTSKLIRRKDKSEIYISARKNKRTGKVVETTSIDVVCISNDTRERFFRDVKHYNGYPKPGETFSLYYYNGDIFTEWSQWMDEEYERQAMLGKKDREMKKLLKKIKNK